MQLTGNSAAFPTTRRCPSGRRRFAPYRNTLRRHSRSTLTLCDAFGELLNQQQLKALLARRDASWLRGKRRIEVRRSSNLSGPLFRSRLLRIGGDVVCVAPVGVPGRYLPFSGIDGLITEPDTFEPVQATAETPTFTPHDGAPRNCDVCWYSDGVSWVLHHDANETSAARSRRQ